MASAALVSQNRVLGHIFKTSKSKRYFVGTMVMAEDLYTKGIESELDRMQDLGGINTVMPFSHHHVQRQYRPNYSPKTDESGNIITDVLVRTHPKYYKNKAWGLRNPKHTYADLDILDELGEAAASRGIEVYARILEPYVITGALQGFEAFAQVDSDGSKSKNVCYNHPDYVGYWDSVIEDLILNHPNLHGFKFGQERGGPFFDSLKDNPATCFCPHCLKRVKKLGIDIKEARNGFNAFRDYARAAHEGTNPANGFFTTFLRLLSEYPAILQYERFMKDSREGQRKRMYHLIKKLNPKVQVGWHIDHSMGWSLGMRAFWPYETMHPYSDWLSIALYFGSIGRRLYNHFMSLYKDLLFADADEQTAYNMYLSILGLDPKKQPSLDQQREGGMAFDKEYIYKEAKRAVLLVGGNTKVYGRIGFDHPGYDNDIQPQQVYEGTKEMFRAGVDGVFCGREWNELQDKNITAFGNALRDYLKTK